MRPRSIPRGKGIGSISDSFKAMTDEWNFDHFLHRCYEELMAGRCVKEHVSCYDKIFLVHRTPVRGTRVDYNEKAISRHKRNHIGEFVLVSNHIKDKTKALEVVPQQGFC